MINLIRCDDRLIHGQCMTRLVQHYFIKNIIVIQFILQAGNIMSIGFEKAFALQTDMNLPASEILSTYVYRMGLLTYE